MSNMYNWCLTKARDEPLGCNSMINYSPCLLWQCVCLHPTRDEVDRLRCSNEASQCKILRDHLFKFLHCLLGLNRFDDRLA